MSSITVKPKSSRTTEMYATHIPANINFKRRCKGLDFKGKLTHTFVSLDLWTESKSPGPFKKPTEDERLKMK